MLLKHLSLHGYKTFANRTEFLFGAGLTAIVGPNGSGKSNIADAMRWVLGEQSHIELRVKKTEEMIFSGSGSRPRMGMAEVYLTLENLDSLSSSDPSAEIIDAGDESDRGSAVMEILRSNPTEVTLGRRAFRDGQNEYFLNGARIRLRDIHELLAHWGLARNTYAVIGQGLIDQALSLRPEERRALFEEAAGIALYQSKRQNAIEKLEETKHNLVRANDIINEIAPRLPSLARQAERAKNYDGVVNALDEKLRNWYAFQWARAQQTAQQAAAREGETRATLNARRREIQDVAARLTGLRRQGQELRARLAEGRRSRTTLESEHHARERDLAVLDERLRFATQRRDEARGEVALAEEAKRAQEEHIARAALDVHARESERETFAVRLREAERSLAQPTDLALAAQSHESWLDQVRALIRRLVELKNEFLHPERGAQIAAELSEEAQRLLAAEAQRVERANVVENMRAQVSDLRTSLAIAERDLASARSAEETARASVGDLNAHVVARSRRVEESEREIESLSTQRAELQAHLEESARALAENDQKVSPVDAELIAAEKSQNELEEKESALRGGLAEFEDAHNRAVLDVERANADITRLETEIEDDLASGRVISPSMLPNAPPEIATTENKRSEAEPSTQGDEELLQGETPPAPEASLALDPSKPTQLRFLVGQEFVAIPVVSAIPEGMEKEIRKLRNQLKYMGAINPNAPQEYEELKSRHAFLTEQAADAHRAIESLHKAIDELDDIMHRKFEETFQAINVEFGNFFTVLFNGGSARLELTQPDDFTQTGIDIVAKPPGKRTAHLAMLSGGERALTAAALLFAILKVSPTPFCVMDEVDAALDEANVGRFRDALRSLAEATQFIVITHNRVTMESADAVYGITMGDDGVSQAISLRLDQTDQVDTEMVKMKTKKRGAGKSQVASARMTK